MRPIAHRHAQRHAVRRASVMVISVVVAAGLALGTAATGLQADVGGVSAIHIYGTGSIGTGAATQTVTLDAATYSDFNTLSIATGDPATSPTPVSGTVDCVGLWPYYGVIVGTTLSDGHQGLIQIADGTPDRMDIVMDTYGDDCTAPFTPTTPLSSGDFTIEPLACPPSLSSPGTDPTDANGDFIADVLQPGSTAAGSFCDGSTSKPTYGSLTDAGGLTLLVTDAPTSSTSPTPSPSPTPTPTATPAPEPGVGVLVTVDPGPAGSQATFSTCGGYTVTVAQASSATITCASVELAVGTGSASVVLSGGSTIVTVGAGGATEVGRDPDGTYAIQNTGSGSIAITTDGVTTALSPGGSTTLHWSFVGFSSPVDMGGVLNLVKAGRAVPLRWRLLDGDGAPVTDLTTATITATSLACDLGTTVDLVEETSPGATGLQNLGDGYYELVWRSPTRYADSCKTLHLDIGDGTTHDALFEFTR